MHGDVDEHGDIIDSALTEEQRQLGIGEIRKLLDRLGPSLRLVEPDSYAWRHFYETGHRLARGCCSSRFRDF